jgi:hypothetical protein
MKDTTFEYIAPAMDVVDMTADAGCDCKCGWISGSGGGS